MTLRLVIDSRLQRVIAFAGIAALCVACFALPTQPNRQDEMSQALGDGTQQFSPEETSALANPNDTSRPGMIHVKRYTDEYTIDFVVDATEENVFFVMDMPTTDQINSVPRTPPPKQEEKKPEEPKPPVDDKPITSSENQASKHIVYAQTYFFEKKYSRALDEVNRAIEYTPNNALAYSLKGTIHYKKGERDLAKSSWTKALELDPGMENVRSMLVQLK